MQQTSLQVDCLLGDELPASSPLPPTPGHRPRKPVGIESLQGSSVLRSWSGQLLHESREWALAAPLTELETGDQRTAAT